MNPEEKVVITEINFMRVKPQGSLIGFASFVINNSFYVGSVGVHGRLEGGIRLVYPRIKDLNVFHPIDKDVGHVIEKAIENHLIELLRWQVA